MYRKGKGRGEYLKHLKGKKLTRQQAILAKCYDCMGFYLDRVYDCEDPKCPLYPYNFYKGDRNTSKEDRNGAI